MVSLTSSYTIVRVDNEGKIELDEGHIKPACLQSLGGSSGRGCTTIDAMCSRTAVNRPPVFDG